MDRQQRQRAVLFAHLASLPSLPTLADWQKLKLVEDAQQAGFGSPSLIKIKSMPLSLSWGSHNPAARQSWGVSESVPLAWEMLVKVHPVARRVVNDLLDGKAIDLRGISSFARPFLFLDASGSVVLSGSDQESQGEEMIVAMVRTLHHFPFPYRRCACGTVFVPMKRQLYCSPACPVRGADSPRKKKRREYMRQYMAAQRKKAKQRARQGRKEQQ